jgi:Zn-dependent peptidase ImmA (M78 family)/transcriptional regulator with XRE-family HTH domain
MFNAKRLVLARKRCGLTKRQLAEAIGVQERSLSGFESGEYPPAADTLERICARLGYDRAFFFGEDMEEVDETSVSFRSMARMVARHRHAAIAAGAFAFALAEWTERRFSLPAVDIPSLHGETPEAAAQILRQEWGLGEKAVRNMVHLLEAKGVRVFSLAENADEVDAFSLWKGGKPFVFLNTFKTAERSRYDAAHELGHLVLHAHGAPNGQEAEREANEFAAAFLMPRGSILAATPRHITLPHMIQLKQKWAVSVGALVRRYRDLGKLSEWHYRSLCVEISEKGYRKAEPNGIARETSRVWEKVFAELRSEGIWKEHIARDLAIPLHELEKLVWGLMAMSVAINDRPLVSPPRRSHLRLVS